MKTAPSYRQKYGYLPYILVLLIPKIGEEAVMKVVESFGGQRIHTGTIVKKWSPVIGEDLAQKAFMAVREEIILHFDVPVMGHFKTLQKYMVVAHEREEGMTVIEIAKKHKMTERSIYKILKHIRENKGFFVCSEAQD